VLNDFLRLRLPYGAGDAGRDHADPTPARRGARVGGPYCEPAPERSIRPVGRATASARSRKRPSTRPRSSAPRASSDAPITPPLQTSGAWPGCFRPTTVLQTRSARGRPCDRHHSRTTNSKPRRRRASESSSPALSPSPTYHSSLMPLRSTSLSALSAEAFKNLWGQRAEARRQTTTRS